MKFGELMEALLKVKNDAQKLGLKEKTIKNLDLVDNNILGGIKKRNFDINLAQDDLRYYLLFKDKK